MNTKPVPQTKETAPAIQSVLRGGIPTQEKDRAMLIRADSSTSLPPTGNLAAAMLACSFALALPNTVAAQPSNGESETIAPTSEAVQLNKIVVEDEFKGSANPYADPDAPYKVDYSASPKLTEPLLNTPKTIITIPKEAIKDSGSTSLRDIFRLQPGLTLGSGEGGNAYGDRVFIRGYDARNDIYVDGLRDPGVISRETFAIEQIEILQGPNSTIGGRGTTGGAVNLVNKTPKPGDFTEVEMTLGTGLTKRLSFDVNRAISPKAALRINGLLHDVEIDGRDEIYDKRQGASVVAIVKPTKAATMMLDYYHLTTDALPDWGHPYDAENNRPYKVDRSNFYGLVDRDFHETSADIGTARIQYEFSDSLQLDAQVRRGVTTNAYVVSKPGFSTGSCPGLMLESQVCSTAARRDQENRFTGGQVNLIKDMTIAGHDHTLVAGLEISEEDIENLPFSVDPRGVIHDLHDPDPKQPWFGSVVPGATIRKNSVDTKAFYLLDTIKFNEQWQVSAGLRHDSYDTKASSGPTDYAEEHSSTNYESDFQNWTIGAAYKPNPIATIYLAASTSSNPPGEQVDAGTSASYGGLAEGFVSYEPERNSSYELGTKWNLLDERLNVSVALFQTNKDNQLLQGGSRGARLYSNDGASRSRGLSLGLTGKASEALSLISGFTYLDTEVREHPFDDEAVGKKLANIPEFSANMMARYQLNPALAFGGTISYQSEVYGGRLAAGSTRIPGYVRLDLMSEYRFSESVIARLNVLNATNETYYDTLYASSVPNVYVAPGRSALLSLTVKF